MIATSHRPIASGLSISVNQSPLSMVMARRRLFSIALPRSVPRMIGTSGTSSLRKTQPIRPKPIMTNRSNDDPEMP